MDKQAKCVPRFSFIRFDLDEIANFFFMSFYYICIENLLKFWLNCFSKVSHKEGISLVLRYDSCERVVCSRRFDQYWCTMLSFCFLSCNFISGFDQKQTSVFSLCTPRLVPEPILTVTWLGLKDKSIFRAEIHAFSYRCFGQCFKLCAKIWQKQGDANALIFHLKNSFVFQT